MKNWMLSFAAAVVLSCASGSAAQAQTSSITFDFGFPKAVNNEIQGEGRYTVAAGLNFVSITLYANPFGGGMQLKSTNTTLGKDFAGNRLWSTKITGAPSASYSVFAELVVRDPATMTETTYTTNTITVLVP
jgi:hypothetical protein